MGLRLIRRVKALNYMTLHSQGQIMTQQYSHSGPGLIEISQCSCNSSGGIFRCDEFELDHQNTKMWSTAIIIYHINKMHWVFFSWVLPNVIQFCLLNWIYLLLPVNEWQCDPLVCQTRWSSCCTCWAVAQGKPQGMCWQMRQRTLPEQDDVCAKYQQTGLSLYVLIFSM